MTLIQLVLKINTAWKKYKEKSRRLENLPTFEIIPYYIYLYMDVFLRIYVYIAYNSQNMCG